MKRMLFLTVTYSLGALVYSALGLWSMLRGGRNGLALLEILCAFAHLTAAVLWGARFRRVREERNGKENG